jgi:5'-nucleotidase
MRILISNDDGVYAPGIKILKEVLDEIAEVIVVAPLEERSATGHTMTLDQPLRLTKIKERVYGCSGFPADCALMGIGHVLKDNRPDLVISGINRGGNLGQDIYYSGTVAAAREATFRGVPAIAVSLTMDFFGQQSNIDHFISAANFIKKLVLNDIHKQIKPMSLLNINVPNLPEEDILGVDITALGFRRYSEEISKREDFKKREYYWIGGVYEGFDKIENSDCNSIEQAKISFSCLNLLTMHSDEKGKWSQVIENLT